MEVKPDKALTLAMLFFVSVLSLVLGIFHYGEASSEGSIYHSALRFKKETGSNIQNEITHQYQKENAVLIEKGQTKSLKREAQMESRRPASGISQEYFQTSLDSEQVEVALRLDELEEQRPAIKAELIAKGTDVPLSLEFEPSLSIALGTFLGVKPSSIGQEDLNKARLTAEDWYHIKSFSGSADFKILLKQGRLTKESLRPKTLRRLYGATHQIVRD